MTVERILTGAALITNPTGLHARPAVKLTKLAKSFEAQLRLRVGQHGKPSTSMSTMDPPDGSRASIGRRSSRKNRV